MQVPTIVVNRQPVVDDDTIANSVSDTLDKLRDIRSAGCPGKRFVANYHLRLSNRFSTFRLRYFREKPIVAARRDGSSHYQHLRFYPVDDNPSTAAPVNTVHFSALTKS